MDVNVQDMMDEFIDDAALNGIVPLQRDEIELCFNMLAEFLVYYSNLFQDGEDAEDAPMDDWEVSLESYVEKLFDGDMEGSIDLTSLPLSALDAEYLRDFLAWHVLREPHVSSVLVESLGEVLRAWALWMQRRHALDDVACHEWCSMLDDVVLEASRAAKAAHLLLYYVRLGAGIAPRLRGQRFEAFVEGHARIERLDVDARQVFLGFDNQDAPVLMLTFPKDIIQYLHEGDVLDVEVGKRGGQWTMVDVGPVYPPCVYIEADELKVPDKLT